MKLLNKAYIAWILIASSAWFAFAPDRASAGDPVIQVGAGTELGFDHSPRLLVQVQYAGVGTGDSDVRYVWVSASMTVGDNGDGTNGIPGVDLEIVPVTRESSGSGPDVQYLPIGISRDLDTGVLGEVKVQAIGWEWNPSVSIANDGSWNLFAQLAVDAVGAHAIALQTGGGFAGGQLGSIAVQGGLSWNPGTSTHVRLSAGGTAGVFAGAYQSQLGSGDVGAAFGTQTSLGARLEVEFMALREDFILFVDGESTRLDLFTDEGDLHNPDFALDVGIEGSF